MIAVREPQHPNGRPGAHSPREFCAYIDPSIGEGKFGIQARRSVVEGDPIRIVGFPFGYDVQFAVLYVGVVQSVRVVLEFSVVPAPGIGRYDLLKPIAAVHGTVGIEFICVDQIHTPHELMYGTEVGVADVVKSVAAGGGGGAVDESTK